MTRDSFITDYWTYYLMLENKLITTFNFVELCDNNLSTYSNEYASLIQSIGSELDEFFKVYCSFPLHERKTISDYANYLFQNEPSITNVEILISEKKYSIIPFSSWNLSCPSKSLSWWQAFDNIKHSRTAHFSDASLNNVLNILGALFILESKYLVRIADISVEPDIPNRESFLFSFRQPINHVFSLKDSFIF